MFSILFFFLPRSLAPTKIEYEQVPDDEDKKDSKVDPVSAVYELVMGMMGTRGQIKYDAAEKAATANGYSTKVFTNMLEQYDKLDVLRVNKSKTHIKLV